MPKLLAKVGDTPGGKRSLLKTAWVDFLHREYIRQWEKGRELRKEAKELDEVPDEMKEAISQLPSRFGDSADAVLEDTEWIEFFRYSTPKEFFEQQSYPEDNLPKFFSGKAVKDNENNIVGYDIFENLKEDARSGLVSIISDPDYDRDRIAGRFQDNEGRFWVKVYLKPKVTKAEFFKRKEKLDSLSSVSYVRKGSD